MHRYLKRSLLAAALVVAVLLGVTALLEETLGEEAVTAVRGQLRSDLRVGGASISLWRDFPYVQIGLRDVELAGYPEGAFLSADHITSRLSWTDLLFEEAWTFNTIRVKAATLNIYRDAERSGNWLVLRERVPGSKATSISFQLSRIILDGVSIAYLDDATRTSGRFRVDEGEVAGRFGSEQYTLTGDLTGGSEFLDLDGMRYVEDFALGAAFELAIDLAANRYRFGPSTVTLDGMPVALAGSFQFERAATVYDLQLHTDRGQLGAVLRALPRQWITPGIRSLRSEGEFTLDGTIAGRYDSDTSPAVRFGGSLRNGRVQISALAREATDVSFALSFTNGEQPSMVGSQLVLANLNAQLDGQPINGNFAWTDFADPFYDVDVSGTVPLNWFDELWGSGTFAGDLTLRNLNVRGRQRSLLDPDQASEVITRGSFDLERAAAIYRGERFDVDALALELRGPDLLVTSGAIEGHGNRVAADLKVSHLVPYILGSKVAVLGFRGSLSAPELDLKAWVATFTDGRAASTKRAVTDGFVGNAPFATHLSADLQLSSGQVRYGKVDAQRFSGSCTLEDSRLRLDGEAYAMEGHWAVDGTVDLRTQMRLSAKLACSEVNVTELFEQTDNVGQQVVAAKHIEGQMTTRAYVEAGWKGNGDWDEDALHVWANVGLTDGELRDFEMLQALSKFVRSKELEHIRFTDTENWIEVVGEQVYLPAMFIQSSATNFTIAGEHSFAQDIDYSVRINGAQLLLNKVFGKNRNQDFVPDRRRGWVKTGLSIEGTLVGDNYDVKMAGDKVRRHFRHSQVRKAAIRKKLVALFGPESLIDDYDDEGERRDRRDVRDLREESDDEVEQAVATRSSEPAGDPPASAARREYSVERPLFGKPGPVPKPAPPLTVDTETYLDFEGDDPTPTGVRAQPLAPKELEANDVLRRPVLSGALRERFKAPPKQPKVEVVKEEYLDFGHPD